MFSQIKNFLLTYFWIPVVEENVHYNVPNTIVYSLLFAVLAVYLGYRIIEWLDIEIDWKFSLGLAPYILFASALRSAEDIGVLKSFFFTTPFIFVFLVPFVLFSLFFSRFIEKKYQVSYHKVWFLIGLVSSGFALGVHSFTNLSGFLLVSGTVLVWLIPLLLIRKRNFLDLNRLEVFIPIAAHLWDASVTFIATKFFPFVEVHVLGSFLIQRFGPIAMFPMKIIFIVPMTYYVWNEVENPMRNYVLLLIALFGLGTGTRDFITLLSLIP